MLGIRLSLRFFSEVRLLLVGDFQELGELLALFLVVHDFTHLSFDHDLVVALRFIFIKKGLRGRSCFSSGFEIEFDSSSGHVCRLGSSLLVQEYDLLELSAFPSHPA